MAPAVVVRRLVSDDAAIAARAIAEIKDGGSCAAVREDVERLRAWLDRDDHVLLVALNGDAPVGFALGYLLDRVDGAARMLFFYEIEVLPTHCRRGIGTRLVEEMKEIARTERVVKMWVQTDPENVAARTLYEKAGAKASEAPDWVYTWTADALREVGRD